MINWSESMEQTYEYYIVDPVTWLDQKQLHTVKSSTINRDSEAETLGSATFDIDETVGECYIRTYLIVNQNGFKEKIALGTHLVQTPSMSFDGKTASVSLDAYTPLLELKEGMPPIGYYIAKSSDKADGIKTNVMEEAYKIVRENARAPVVKPKCDKELYYNFIADTSDTWLSYTKDLIADVKYIFDLDETGRILFAPKQDTASLRPIWTYTDDNSSILYPDLSLEHDLYDIPNVVEVVYSNGAESFYAKVVNDDPNSPISTVKRGREIVHRITDPYLISYPFFRPVYYKVNKINDNVYERSKETIDIPEDDISKAVPTTHVTTLGDKVLCAFETEGDETTSYYYCVVNESHQIKEYANQCLRELSTIVYSVSYTHGYCPVRLGDCVMLNYKKAGLNNIKAKVVSQSIKCEPGCPVTEKAVFTTKLWG